jgi:hypothetical protein
LILFERAIVPVPQLRTNPFYPLLVVVGLVFALTACSYGALIVNMLQPDRAAEIREAQYSYFSWLDRNGTLLLTVELGLLALFTFLAIGTDDYWTKQNEPTDKRQEK